MTVHYDYISFQPFLAPAQYRELLVSAAGHATYHAACHDVSHTAGHATYHTAGHTAGHAVLPYYNRILC